jgi:DNA-binding response OmpR family regulator
MTKPRILIVDDEPNLSDLVRMYLEKTESYEVRVENISSQAVAAAREFEPDLFLLDVDMPGKQGGELARELKALPRFKQTPVIFLTSLISREEAGNRESVRGGMRFLAKPVSAKVLLEAVGRALAGETVQA